MLPNRRLRRDESFWYTIMNYNCAALQCFGRLGEPRIYSSPKITVKIPDSN
ncbi:hypothetical protein SXCC_01402 [Gluconacetobacter sp. SXCC-1]|nr:hypothetical protein SXCC_01402 [Gluconacetobacter sp. SXCC-1]